MKRNLEEEFKELLCAYNDLAEYIIENIDIADHDDEEINLSKRLFTDTPSCKLQVIYSLDQNFKIFPPKIIWFGRCSRKFCTSKQHKLRKSSSFCVKKCIFGGGT